MRRQTWLEGVCEELHTAPNLLVTTCPPGWSPRFRIWVSWVWEPWNVLEPGQTLICRVSSLL